MTERFKITWRDAHYYVSIPNYSGGEVVDAASFEELVKALKIARTWMPTIPHSDQACRDVAIVETALRNAQAKQE